MNFLTQRSTEHQPNSTLLPPPPPCFFLALSPPIPTGLLPEEKMERGRRTSASGRVIPVRIVE